VLVLVLVLVLVRVRMLIHHHCHHLLNRYPQFSSLLSCYACFPQSTRPSFSAALPHLHLAH
jgi:hypothetical protein